MKKMGFAFMGALALLFTFGLIGTVEAQEIRPLRGRQLIHGRVSAVDAETLTVEGSQQVVVLITRDDTRVHIIGQSEAGLGDLSVGDFVLARGVRLDNGDVLARAIFKQPEGDRVAGRVASVDEDGLTLTRAEQEIAVFVDEDAIVRVHGEELRWGGEPSGAAEIIDGMHLLAFGTASEDGLEMDAHTLIVIRTRPRLLRLAGQVSEVGSESFMLETLRNDQFTILITDETRMIAPGVEQPSIDDIDAGDGVIVVGRPSADSEVTAVRVVVLPENRPLGRPLLGQIESMNGPEFTLRTFNGEVVTVTTNQDTQYRIGNVRDASLADFQPGDRIAVFGQRHADDESLLATHVFKRR